MHIGRVMQSPQRLFGPVLLDESAPRNSHVESSQPRVRIYASTEVEVQQYNNAPSPPKRRGRGVEKRKALTRQPSER